MKITIDFSKKRTWLMVALLIYLMFAASVLAARERRTATTEEQKPSIAGQFVGGFSCMIGCGWPAMVILILPAIAVWFWKKFITLG